MLTRERVIESCGGALRCADRFPHEVSIATDTRSIMPGETFLALRGERFDGHAFVGQALANGAAALIVADAAVVPPDVPAVIVDDTTRAYMRLAAANRRASRAHVVGITGSTGKTTTKHLLAQLLQHFFGENVVLVTPANENNEIGVSKLLLRLDRTHVAAVVEMGARHYGEIAELVEVALPDWGILTNIGEAHLEIFGSRERLAETKWGLFASRARPILCANDEESRQRAPSLSQAPRWFGGDDAALPGAFVPNSSTVIVRNGELKRLTVDVRLPGAHNRANLAAAIAAALEIGVPLQAIAEQVPHLTLPAGRFETIVIAGLTRVIYDAYNANLSGMMAALDAFCTIPARRHIAVLSSMAELGERSAEMHERVGAKVAAMRIDVLLASGDYRHELIAGAVNAGFPRAHIVAYDGNEQAARWLRSNATPQDLVLLKGSRKYAMEEIVEALRAKVSA